jgi:hypothetical protein
MTRYLALREGARHIWLVGVDYLTEDSPAGFYTVPESLPREIRYGQQAILQWHQVSDPNFPPNVFDAEGQLARASSTLKRGLHFTPGKLYSTSRPNGRCK